MNRKIIELQEEFFLITDALGQGHLYSRNPKEIEDDRLYQFEVDITQKIVGRCSGYTDRFHPIQIQAKFVQTDEGEHKPFVMSTMYILSDAKGFPHLLSADPAKVDFNEKRYKRFLVDFPEEIVKKVGSVISKDAPVSVRLRYIPAAIVSPFSIADVVPIAKGEKQAHFEDADGNTILISAERQRNDNEYPLIGEVMHSKTEEFLDMRFYSLVGECFDEKPTHALETVMGYAFGKKTQK